MAADGDNRVLLELMQLGQAESPDYRQRALAWLNGGVEFDGWVWGSGRRMPDGSVLIDEARLEGRSQALLAEFDEVAALTAERDWIDQHRLLAVER